MGEILPCIRDFLYPLHRIRCIAVGHGASNSIPLVDWLVKPQLLSFLVLRDPGPHLSALDFTRDDLCFVTASDHSIQSIVDYLEQWRADWSIHVGADAGFLVVIESRILEL